MSRPYLNPGLVALIAVLPLFCRISALPDSGANVPFSLSDRGSNKDRSRPVYKNPDASIEARVADLLPRMTLEEKVAQL